MACIRENSFSVIVKPNARKTKVLGYDDARNAYLMSVAAPPEDNKANIEIVRFLSKELGKGIRIISGKTSKRKLIRTDG